LSKGQVSGATGQSVRWGDRSPTTVCRPASTPSLSRRGRSLAHLFQLNPRNWYTMIHSGKTTPSCASSKIAYPAILGEESDPSGGRPLQNAFLSILGRVGVGSNMLDESFGSWGIQKCRISWNNWSLAPWAIRPTCLTCPGMIGVTRGGSDDRVSMPVRFPDPPLRSQETSRWEWLIDLIW
jgi:hypothetical protein